MKRILFVFLSSLSLSLSFHGFPCAQGALPSNSFPSQLQASSNTSSAMAWENNPRVIKLVQWLQDQSVQRQAQSRIFTNLDSPAPTAPQAKALAALESRAGVSVEVRFRSSQGTPLLIKGASLQPRFSGPVKASSDVEALTAQQFLWANRDLLKIADPDAELFLVKHDRDTLGYHHLRFEQRYLGLVVYPCELTVHLDRSGQVYLMNGAYIPTPQGVATNATISVETAQGAALQKLGLVAVERFSETQLVIYGPIDKSTPRLAWKFELIADGAHAWNCLVDALDGTVLATISQVHSESASTSALDGNGVSLTFNVWRDGANYYMVDSSKPMFDPASQMPNGGRGVIAIYDGGNKEVRDPQFAVGLVQSTSLTSGWDADAVGAAYGLSKTYDYYRERFNRNSLDGQGGVIRAIVRYGNNVQNAFWFGSTKTMVFGFGFTRQIDISGHELTHGVMNSVGNGGILEYINQSGALNEALADIFGELVEAYHKGASPDWLKADPFAPTDRSKLLQDYANPGSVSQITGRPNPAKMSEFIQLTEDQDNGGVHINSSIINHCFYSLAVGLEGGLGLKDAEQVFYRAMTTHLQKQSQFIDMRHACVSAAEEIFGANSIQASKTVAAFDYVEIKDAPSTPPPSPIPTVNSPDSTLAVRYDWFDDGYMLVRREAALGDGSDGTILNTVNYIAPRRPSVSGNGNFCVFVTEDNDVASINTDGTDLSFGDVPGLVHSVAAAPNGVRYALVAKDPDTGTPINEIWIIEIDPVSLRRVKLFAPASEGAKLDIVKFADAMDFRHDSRTLIYDAYSEIRATSGQVFGSWNLFSMDTTDESIQVVIDLNEGLDFGNPSLGQTKDYLLTYEVIEKKTGISSILAANLQNGDRKALGQVQDADVTAFPAYNGDDSAVIYTAEDLATFTGYSIVRQELAADHVTPQGQPSLWLEDAMMAVIYRRGTFVSSNALPAVRLTQPLGGQVLTPPAQVVIEAEASDPDGQIVKVEFYEGSTKLMELTAPPYRISLSELPTRTYRFLARATDNVGGVTDSPAIEVIVGTPGGGGSAPRLALSRVSSNLQFSWPASATGYILQWTDRLGPAASWSGHQETPVPTGDQLTVTLPVGGGTKYYRLAKP